MKITKMFWGNYYKLPYVLRNIITLLVIIAVCVLNPPIPALILITYVFIGLAIWSQYYGSI